MYGELSHRIITLATLLLIATTLIGCSSEKAVDSEAQTPAANAQTKEPAPSDLAKQTGSQPDLIVATVEGDLDAVKQFLAAGADTNQRDDNKNTPLGLAALFGHTDIARALIESGADLNAQNKEGATPLMNAAFFCQIETTQLLLDRGADRNIKNNAGATPLQALEATFEETKWIYDLMNVAIFQPMGSPLDYEKIKASRPLVAESLRSK